MRFPVLSPSPPGMDDAGLFRSYQESPGEQTFCRLARRHLPLVWSTALRLVNGDAALAEDVTQVVLTDFAIKAPALPAGTVAAGWLHRHTCFTAGKMVRTEIRRRARDQAAARLQASDAMPENPGQLWTDAAPFLDHALNQLAGADREAILLRFWQQHDHQTIGTLQGSSAEAARKRIARALERLHRLLHRRGVVLPLALLAPLLTEQTHAAAAASSMPKNVAASLPGAAWRQASLTGVRLTPGARSGPRWPQAAAIGLLVTAAAIWISLKAGWLSQNHPERTAPGSTGASTLEVSGTARIPVSLRFTLAEVSAKLVQTQLLMLDLQEDHGDLLVWLQNTAAGGSNCTIKTWDITGEAGRLLKLDETHQHFHPTQWSLDARTNEALPEMPDYRLLGTLLEATVAEAQGGGTHLKWSIRHTYAEPEPLVWTFPLQAGNRITGKEVAMECFHETAANGSAPDLEPGKNRLLMIQQVPSSLLPAARPEPRTILLFAVLNPPGSHETPDNP